MTYRSYIYIYFFFDNPCNKFNNSQTKSNFNLEIDGCKIIKLIQTDSSDSKFWMDHLIFYKILVSNSYAAH